MLCSTISSKKLAIARYLSIIVSSQKAKTDKIDAKMLTIYGAKMQETLTLARTKQKRTIKGT
jgi:hypothetical protein